MKTRIDIERRLAREQDAFAIETLRWVLESNDCPFCDSPNMKEYELEIKRDEIEPAYLEKKHNWPQGTCDEHMDNHIQYDPEEAAHIEKMRQESISTLDMAEGIVIRLVSWLDELEQQRGDGEITSDWIHDATKLAGQANQSLKLVGQLKKEIGVESQLLLAEAQMGSIMGALCHVLSPHPELLDQVELHFAALKAPTHTIEAEFEVSE
tara:strand:+ start:4470 stop:5096 length:627 start_codon:yes stop_codon:yes gene_type:complete